MQSLKILYSAYACEPGKGSEPGIGWHWALETARLGHQVWVMTRANNREIIEQACAAGAPPAGLHFVYYDLPRWAAWWKRGGRGVHLYYVLWQWGAWRAARTLHGQERFDAVHHITFGVMRHPIFMSRLRIPCVVGPVGGGESTPPALRRHYPFRERCRDALRDLANLAARFDPWVRGAYAQAALILAKTPETLRWLGRAHRGKSECMLELGIQAVRGSGAARVREPGRIRLLYVGRFLPFKGMGLGLPALARLRAQGVDASLTMIGQGPQAANWQALCREHGVADAVTWVPWMRQEDLLRSYQEFDALLFPSLHDSSGNVVLEAMASGLPVVCLNLGGPAQLVDSSCGRVVAVAGRSEAQVIDGLAAALVEIADSPALARSLGAGAVVRARRFAWADVVARVWGSQGCGYRLVNAPGGGYAGNGLRVTSAP
ncbi:MAG TPA: glycosyltransferase family 4 protein [Burkholderiales bacterium]|nr:glycosyltransferase family 4 protein [Burkholderiales bacterium]